MRPKFMKSLGIDVTSNLQTEVCKRNIKIEGWDESKYKKQCKNLNPTLQSSKTSLFLALLPEQPKPRSNVIGRKLKNQYHLLVIHSLKSCLTLGDPKDCSPRDSWTWDFPGQYTRVGCHFLLQRVFPAEVKNPCLLGLLHWQADSLQQTPKLCCCSVAQLCPTLCNSLRLQDMRLPCPSLSLKSLLKLISIELMIPSNHFILCCPLLLLPSIFSSIRVFSNEQFFVSGGQSIGA